METFTLRQLFGLSEKFYIPAYQRAYAWGNTQREQLIEDLKDAKGHYYLGHFLFEKIQDEQDEHNENYIIDGQQRMTTIVIFYSCLIQEFKKRHEEQSFINNLRRSYLINNSDLQRFHTVNYDDNLFRRYIIERGEDESSNQQLKDSIADSSSQKNIIDCRNYFDRIFSDIDTAELKRCEKVLSNARITYLEVHSKVDAAQIFAFQNDRGKDLTDLEVLKSFFMLQIYLKGGKKQTDLINSLEESYRKIYGIIVKMKTNEDFVLRYFWMAYNKGYNTEKPLQEIKEDYKKREINDVTRFLEDLGEAFKYVQEVEQSIVPVVVNLRRENNMAWSLPVLIKANVVAKVGDATMNCLLHLLENFTFRAMVRGGRANVESRLNKLIDGAITEKVFKDNILIFIDNMQNDYWSDKQFREALNSGYIYNRSRACSYWLWRYEESLQGKGYEHNLYWIEDETLEHIAPQTEKGVPIANGYGDYDDKDDANKGIESGEWLHSIGNMLLASRSHNSSLGNKDFKEKLESYGEANILIRQKELKGLYKDAVDPLWDYAAIQKRGGIIIEAAMKIWDISKVKAMLPSTINTLF